MPEEETNYIRYTIPSIKTTVVYEDETLSQTFRGKELALNTIPAVQISEHHGRAVVDERVKGNIIWADSNGIVYGTRDWKGALIPDFSEVNLEDDPTSPYGLMARGLLDFTDFESEIERVTKASSILRANGLPTEAPVRISRIKELIYNGEKLATEQVKRLYLQRREKELENIEDPIVLEREKDKFDREKKYFQSTDFYIIERYLQRPERLRDLVYAPSREDLFMILGSTFRWLNTVFRGRKSGLISGSAVPNHFDISKNEDVVRYFTQYLPQQMGTYLGRLHRLGLVHNNATDQNWSVVGTLYDLQTVTGVSLGDKLSTEKDYVDEVVSVGTGIHTILFTSLRSSSYLTLLPLGEQPIIIPVKQRVWTTFVSSYLRELLRPLIFNLKHEEKINIVGEKARVFCSDLYSRMMPFSSYSGKNRAIYDIEYSRRIWEKNYNKVLEEIINEVLNQ